MLQSKKQTQQKQYNCLFMSNLEINRNKNNLLITNNIFLTLSKCQSTGTRAFGTPKRKIKFTYMKSYEHHY